MSEWDAPENEGEIADEYTLDPDWSLLEHPGVDEVIERVVTNLDVELNLDMDRDDLAQEAVILVTTKADLRMLIERYELGLLYHGLRSDLLNKADVQIKQRARLSSYEGLREAEDEAAVGEYIGGLRESEDAEVEPRQEEYRNYDRTMRAAPHQAGYTRELVEHLLPAVWDGDCDYGMRNPYAPEPGMPKATVNLKESGTLYAHLADIRSAWAKAPLLMEHRRALLLRHGFDWTQKEIGFNQGITQQAAQQRIERGVGIIVNFLNGTDVTRCESVAFNDKENNAA